MELMDVSSEVVADNTNPLTAIPINSPRGESIKWINKVLLEGEKGASLAIDATRLRVRVRVRVRERESSAENEEIRKRNN